MRAIPLLLALLALAALALPLQHGYAARVVVGVRVEGVITEATADCVSAALREAEGAAAPLLIVINTPGGSLDATIKIVESLLNARVPVITYVYPVGAKAWSAGSFVLLAGHIAAMAPGTVMGSAQPVAYSPMGAEPVTEPKILNAVAKYIEQVAKARGRNGTAARLLVTENLNLGAEEALRAGVIDLIAANIDELLAEVDGLRIVARDVPYVLETRGAAVYWFKPGLRHYIASLLSHPLIATILFMAGLYALIFGLAHSELASATVGGLMILLSLIGMGFSVNVVALLLIAVGVLLLIAEALVIPGFGAAGITGAVMVVIGGLLSPISMDPTKWMIHAEWYRTLMLVSIAAVAPLAAFALVVVYKVARVRRQKPRLPLTDMAGLEGEAVDEIGPGKEGFVFCEGEYWRATSDETIRPGEKVVVVRREGLKLVVRRKR